MHRTLIAALAIAFALPAFADTITAANLPKFDIQAGCKEFAHIDAAEALPGHSSPSEIALSEKFGAENCGRFQAQMRDALLGKDVSPELLQFCELDVKLHGDAGLEYPNLFACIGKEPGSQNLRKIKDWLRAGLGYCTENPDYTMCYRDEERIELLMDRDPAQLASPKVWPCVDRLKAMGEPGKSWQQLDQCLLGLPELKPQYPH